MEQKHWAYDFVPEQADFELPGMIRRTHRIEQAICPTGQDPTSNAVDLRGYGMIGLIVPTIDTANLTFTVSETEAGTYRTVYNDDGSVWTIICGAGNRVISADDLAPLCAYRWVRVVPSAEQTAVRTLRFVVKA